MSHDNQPVFYKPFFLVVIASVAFMALIATMITSNNEADSSTSTDAAPTISEAETQEIAEVTAPVAKVAVAGSADSAATPAADGGEVSLGQSTYDGVCAACHGMGIAGAPKFADAAAWTDRIAQGNDTLYSNAINGFTGASGAMMPAKGGRADLSDDAVKAAVDYMLEAVGVEAASAEPAPAAAEETTAEETTAETAAAPAAGDKGKEVYDSVCFACHAMGIAGAPKFADAAAWTDRIAKGNDTMYSNAINGFMGEAGLMPPKGGAMDLSDDDVKAAVDYMVTNSQ